MNDPSTQFLASCSPVGTPRQGALAVTVKQRAELDEYRAKQARKVPSPSSHIDERKPFSMDKLLPKSQAAADAEKEEHKRLAKGTALLKKARVVKVAPAVALYNQKLRRVSRLSKLTVCSNPAVINFSAPMRNIVDRRCKRRGALRN